MKENKPHADSGKGRLARIRTAYGQLEAEVIKSRLESEGIPALLRYESVSAVYGIFFDGLGKVDILVPVGMAEDAARVLSEEPGQAPEAGNEPGDTEI